MDLWKMKMREGCELFNPLLEQCTEHMTNVDQRLLGDL